MRVLHVIDDLHLGGAERNLISVIPELRGIQHHVVHLMDGTACVPALKAAGATVEQVPLRRAADLPRALARLRELAAAHDVVHTQCWRADLVGRAAAVGRAAIVTTVQTSPYEPAIIRSYSVQGQLLAGGVWLTDLALSSLAADCMVAVSESVREVVVRRLRVPAERTRVVYNAVNLQEFRPLEPPARSAAREALGLSAEDLAVVTVGQVIPNKGQPLLLEAWPAVLRQAPAAVLLVVGEGFSAAPLRERAQALGLGDRVRFLGRRSDVPRVLGAADLFVLASYVEGLPLSVVEAMGSALPCLLSPIPPHRELADLVAQELTSWTGPPEALIVPAQTPQAWAQALVARLARAHEREALGRAGRQAALRHFDAQVTAPALARVFEDAAEVRARRRRLG